MPSLTEALSAWGCTPIACTRFCERPDLPAVGGTKDPDVGLVLTMRPDVVVMDAEENRREDYEALVASGIDVHVTRVRSLFDVNATLDLLARRVGARRTPFDVPDAASRRCTAFVPIWRKPWLALGSPTYGSSLLAHLGIANVITGDASYPPVALDDARVVMANVVLAPSEPYPFTRRQVPELSAVAPTLLVDGKDLFWWGERTPAALVRLADRLDAGLRDHDR